MAFFPDEARDDGIEGGSARLRVRVDGEGHVVDATSLDDPGHGFARAATRALRSGACVGTAARGRDGRPIDSFVMFTVRFELTL